MRSPPPPSPRIFCSDPRCGVSQAGRRSNRGAAPMTEHVAGSRAATDATFEHRARISRREGAPRKACADQRFAREGRACVRMVDDAALLPIDFGRCHAAGEDHQPSGSVQRTARSAARRTSRYRSVPVITTMSAPIRPRRLPCLDSAGFDARARISPPRGPATHVTVRSEACRIGRLGTA